MAKRLCRVGSFLAVCLTPSVCFGIGDGIDGAVILFALLKFELAWTIFTLAVFLLLLLRKMSSERRIAYFVMLWIGQILYPFGLEIVDVLNGEPGTHIAEQVTKPVVLGGVTFPAGSQADYVRLGGGFWRRKLVEVTSASPVKLGSWEITHLNLTEPYGDVAHVWLVRPETIDGWPCDKAPGLTLTSARPLLRDCELIEPRSIGDVVWQRGTFVNRAADDGWALQWYGGRTTQAFGFAVDSMSATYNASLELQTSTSDLANADFEVGDYKFFKGDTNVLSWQPPGELRIRGYAKNAKTGAEVRCLRVNMSDRATHPCDDEGKDQHRDPSNEASGNG